MTGNKGELFKCIGNLSAVRSGRLEEAKSHTELFEEKTEKAGEANWRGSLKVKDKEFALNAAMMALSTFLPWR